MGQHVNHCATLAVALGIGAKSCLRCFNLQVFVGLDHVSTFVFSEQDPDNEDADRCAIQAPVKQSEIDRAALREI